MFYMVTNLISERERFLPSTNYRWRHSCTICSPPRPGPSVFRWPRLPTGTTPAIRARWTCILPLPAVKAVIETFQSKCVLKPEDDAFRRYLLRAMARGAMRNYFRRGENDGIRAAADLAAFAVPKKASRNEVEEEIITWELLEQVMSLPQLRPPVRATLECIRSLGPDHALKEHAFTASGDPDAWKRERGRRPILDPKAIARSMGVNKAKVHQYPREARIILRQAFNQDGKLFLTR